MAKYTLYRRVPLLDIVGKTPVFNGTKGELKSKRRDLIKASGTFWTKDDFKIVRDK